MEYSIVRTSCTNFLTVWYVRCQLLIKGFHSLTNTTTPEDVVLTHAVQTLVEWIQSLGRNETGRTEMKATATASSPADDGGE